MAHYVRHIAGDMYEGIQCCVLCGEVLMDIRNCMWPAGQDGPGQFAVGDLFVREAGGCTSFVPQISATEDTWEGCEE